MKNFEQLLKACQDDFSSHFGVSPSFIAYAPGRINIIGEHTDYNQGLALPCAINRWVVIGMSPRSDRQVHVVSRDFKSEMSLVLEEQYDPQTTWERYVYGCMLLFQQQVSMPYGFNALIEGNVPIGAGVSSSAALEVAFMNGLNHLFHDALDPLALILMCQQVEHQHLQVKSGLLDQYASQFSRAGQFMMLDFKNLSHQYINATFMDCVWVLCDTKVKRTLAGSKYSERVEETQRGLAMIQRMYPECTDFRAIEKIHLAAVEDLYLQKRLRHYVTENERVKMTLDALSANDMDSVGNLMTASHLSLRDDYEVSCEELDFLVEEAIATNYCLGSRMMGGGFGGCTINLVKVDHVAPFIKKIREAYFNAFRIEADINIYQSVQGAGIYTVVKDVSYSA
jgi:galactokinase